MTKKFFALKFIELNPTLKSTGEVPSIWSIYGYLNGSREIKAELLPYIAKVLDVGISELFEDNKKDRVKILQNILKKSKPRRAKTFRKLLQIWRKTKQSKTTKWHKLSSI